MSVPAVAFSQGYALEYPSLPLSVGYVADLNLAALPDALAAARMRVGVGAPDSEIEGTLNCYSAFFRSKAHEYPVAAQISRWRKEPPPSLPPLVELLLLAEVSTGALLGIQDLDATRDPLVCDLAAEGEEFPGMRGLIRCTQGEIVIRDQTGIIASYFQGPDARTKVVRRSRNLLLLGFHAPSCSATAPERGLGLIADVLRHAASEAEFHTVRS